MFFNDYLCLIVPCYHRSVSIKVRGFTLIELIVVITIVGILASVAVPSLSDTLARQRAKSVSSELLASLSKTRSEAVSRNSNITLMPKTNQWIKGWQILDSFNVVLDDRKEITNVNISGPNNVIYSPSGRIIGGNAPVFLISVTNGTLKSYRCISVDLGGRPYIKSDATC